jgi:hypothetical protein
MAGEWQQMKNAGTIFARRRSKLVIERALWDSPTRTLEFELPVDVQIETNIDVAKGRADTRGKDHLLDPTHSKGLFEGLSFFPKNWTAARLIKERI